MSVQLIVYPQGNNGVYNKFSNPATDFIVNGLYFFGLENTPTAGGTDIPLTMAIYPPYIPNSWYRFGHSGVPSQPVIYPTVSNNNLFLGTTSGIRSGVYQRVTDLSVGVAYEVIIDIKTPPQAVYNGTIKVVVQKYNFTSGITTNHPITETTTQIKSTISPFILGPQDTVVFVGYNGVSDNCEITQIQIQPKFGSSGSVLLDDGQVICDLYEDEDLPLTLSVDEFKNVAEKPQSYSKAFNLPATKRNNKIFDHIFEITRHLDGGSPQFNPYQKTECVLKQNGLLIFEGYLRMLDIVDKEGEISYNVNLYSEVIALADLLKDRKFNLLDFTELDHEYDRVEIERSNFDGVTLGQTTPMNFTNPNTSGFRTPFNTIKYPFIDWNRQWVVANGSSNAAVGDIELTTLEQAFRPCLNIKYLIDRIFQQPDIAFTYTSNFFNSTEFSELFMDFNWGADESGSTLLIEGSLGREFDEVADYYFNSPTFTKFKLNQSTGFTSGPDLWDNTNYNFTSPINNLNVIVIYLLTLINTDILGSRSNELRICKFNAAGNVIETFDIDSSSISPGGTKAITGTFTTVLQAGQYIQAQANSQSTNKIRIQLTNPNSFMYFDFANLNTASSVSTLLNLARKDLNQWEFLKGIFTMFNLITIPDKNNPSNIIIEPYVSTFINNRAKQLNWTDKIDISEMKLEPLTNLNLDTLFKYAEDEDDYAFQNFKEATSGFLYGSLEFAATNEFNILEGIDEIEASPFAATVIKSIDDDFPNFVTPAMYSVNDDGVSEPFDNSPRIFYNRGTTGGVSYYIPAQNAAPEIQATTYGYFSHLRFSALSADARDLNFGSQQLLPNVLGATPNNLYNLFWSDYFNELYNINTRIMTIKVNLTPADINTFQFNQKVFIKNRLFRVNRIDYKPNDLSVVEFILLPSLATDNVAAPS